MPVRPPRTALVLLVATSLLAAVPASARSPIGSAEASAVCLPPGAPKCIQVKVKVNDVLPPLPAVPECVPVPGLRERCEGWTSRLDMAGSSDRPWHIAVSPSGDPAFVTGESWEAGGRPDSALESYDVSSGAIRWT